MSGDDFDENVDFLDRYDGERSLMFVDFDGDVQVEADGGEAEDNTFARDWHWVEAAIRRAYELGVKHGTEAKPDDHSANMVTISRELFDEMAKTVRWYESASPTSAVLGCVSMMSRTFVEQHGDPREVKLTEPAESE